MYRKLFFVLCLFWCVTLAGQPTTGNLVVTNTGPVYKLSPDGQSLCVYEINDNNDKWAMFLNLKDFTWQPKTTINLMYSNIALSPDLQSVMGNAVNLKGYKGDDYWGAYDKFSAFYYPDARNYQQKTSWADRFFIIGQMPDGHLLAASDLSFEKSEQFAFSNLKARTLNVVNPANGEVVRTVRSFPRKAEFNIPNTWTRPIGFVIDEGKLFVRSDDMQHFHTLRLSEGMPAFFRTQVAIMAISGKYGIGREIVYGKTDQDYVVRKLVINLENNQVVYEQKLPNGASSAYEIAQGRNGLYTLDGNAILRKEEWTGTELVVKDSTKLDIDGMFYGNKWGSKGSVRLFVSEAANKVLLIPAYWSDYSQQAETFLAWTLNDGKLAFVNPNFLQPSAKYLARLNRPRLTEVPLNVLVKTYNGLFTVLGQDKTSRKWQVIKYVKDRKGDYERQVKEENAEAFIPAALEIVSFTPCPRCKNTGLMSVVNRVTTEKTDKMIYNQITTTYTRDVLQQAICGDCRGIGYAGIR